MLQVSKGQEWRCGALSHVAFGKVSLLFEISGCLLHLETLAPKLNIWLHNYHIGETPIS